MGQNRGRRFQRGACGCKARLRCVAQRCRMPTAWLDHARVLPLVRGAQHVVLPAAEDVPRPLQPRDNHVCDACDGGARAGRLARPLGQMGHGLRRRWRAYAGGSVASDASSRRIGLRVRARHQRHPHVCSAHRGVFAACCPASHELSALLEMHVASCI